MEVINRYFWAEKWEGLLFVIIGVLAIGLAFFLFKIRDELWSAAYPLVAIALIQIGVGGGVFLRSDRQLAEVQAQFQANPVEMAKIETPRMITVNNNFLIYKWIEIFLFAVGVLLTFLYRGNLNFYGVGIGLIG